MKNLILKSGIILQFIDSSTINNLVTVVEDFVQVEDLRTVLSEDNLSECIFDNVTYKDVQLTKISANASDYGNVTVVVSTKLATDSEIEALKQQIAELENENAQLTDKAEAADILMGNEEV